MKWYQAVIWVENIRNFEKTLEKINIEKADIKRDGAYTKALKQLEDVKEGKTDLEDIFGNPNNTLRNIILLSSLDSTDAATKK